MSEQAALWNYRARITNIVDGDTVDVQIDAGFHATLTVRLRLLGINAPEMHGISHNAGIAAKDALTAWVEQHQPVGGWPLVIHTEKTDAFGRYLADVRCGDESLNEFMLEKGFAVPFK